MFIFSTALAYESSFLGTGEVHMNIFFQFIMEMVLVYFGTVIFFFFVLIFLLVVVLIYLFIYFGINGPKTRRRWSQPEYP